MRQCDFHSVPLARPHTSWDFTPYTLLFSHISELSGRGVNSLQVDYSILEKDSVFLTLQSQIRPNCTRELLSTQFTIINAINSSCVSHTTCLHFMDIDNATYDHLVIGEGVGGIYPALTANQHGTKVAVIEEDRLGGTCVNAGIVHDGFLSALILTTDFQVTLVRSLLGRSFVC